MPLKRPQGRGINTMNKSNVAEKFVVVPEVVAEVSAPAVMTIVKEEPVEVRKLTLDEKIQKVEDLSLMIDRWRTLSDSRRKLQTFQIGADSLSSTILLKDGAGNEFRTSNSTVCKYRVKIAQVHRLKSEQLSDVKIPFPSIYAS